MIIFFKRKRRVLLIIDLQELFVKERTLKIKESIQSIIRKYKFDAIIQTVWFNTDDSNFVKRLNYDKGIEVSSLVLHKSSEIIISRCGYSTITEEMEQLLDKDDDIIFVTGLETDACVLGTCMDLFSKGYNFYVVTDAIGSNDFEAHNNAFYLMQRNFGRNTFIPSSMIDNVK